MQHKLIWNSIYLTLFNASFILFRNYSFYTRLFCSNDDVLLQISRLSQIENARNTVIIWTIDKYILWWTSKDWKFNSSQAINCRPIFLAVTYRKIILWFCIGTSVKKYQANPWIIPIGTLVLAENGAELPVLKKSGTIWLSRIPNIFTKLTI